jgi:desulfoferrodoxin (superoxide reductase-like protein)
MTDLDGSMGSSRRRLLIGSLAAAAIPATGLVVPAAQAAEAQGLGLFEGINRAKNPNAMTALEKLHVPHFTGPSTAKKGESVALAVSVGIELHPMTMMHWIERLRVFDSMHMPIADVTFARVGVQPVCEFHIPVMQTMTLIAQCFCNIHGTWEARHTITVA